jgi:uncharacterized integral membrane protein
MPLRKSVRTVFGFVQWDSPLALVLEVALSLAIIAGLLFVVRRVNAQAEAERRRDATLTPNGLESGSDKQNDQYSQ